MILLQTLKALKDIKTPTTIITPRTDNLNRPIFIKELYNLYLNNLSTSKFWWKKSMT